MATTMSEPPPTTKAAPPPAPPCTTPTTGPPLGHQGELHQSAAAPADREPRLAEEHPVHQAPSPPPAVRKPATTLDPRPDSPTSATPSSTPSLVGARANSLHPILPQQPATSQETAASWTPLPSWPTTTMDTPPITRPTVWVSPRPAWPRWRPAPLMRCTGWDPG